MALELQFSTVITSPIPILKVCSIPLFSGSLSGTLPILRKLSKTSGTIQLPQSNLASNPTGNTRTKFSGKPPPVMCAMEVTDSPKFCSSA